MTNNDKRQPAAPAEECIRPERAVLVAVVRDSESVERTTEFLDELEFLA